MKNFFGLASGELMRCLSHRLAPFAKPDVAGAKQRHSWASQRRQCPLAFQERRSGVNSTAAMRPC